MEMYNIAVKLAEMCVEMKEEGEISTNPAMDKLISEYLAAKDAKPAGEWYVSHDGDSRPIIHGPGQATYSIGKFDSRAPCMTWGPYEQEEEHCRLFCEMANNELHPPKPGMQIMAKDNFDRDGVSDELVAENVPIFYAEKIKDYLNIRFSGDNAQRIYTVELPDYTLYKFRP